MTIDPGIIANLDLLGPAEDAFLPAVETLLGRPADGVLKAALPYSVVAVNRTPRAVALLGVRFDMQNPRAKAYSVIHYADTLRHPENAALQPGAMRFVCAEPLYTDFVLRRATEVHARALLNLHVLRQALEIRASIDCAAFDDGEFAGPDSLSAFERFATERQAELSLLAEILVPGAPAERIVGNCINALAAMTSDRAVLARKVLARRLQEAQQSGGSGALAECARAHRVRVALWRAQA